MSILLHVTPICAYWDKRKLKYILWKPKIIILYNEIFEEIKSVCQRVLLTFKLYRNSLRKM